MEHAGFFTDPIELQGRAIQATVEAINAASQFTMKGSLKRIFDTLPTLEAKLITAPSSLEATMTGKALGAITKAGDVVDSLVNTLNIANYAQEMMFRRSMFFERGLRNMERHGIPLEEGLRLLEIPRKNLSQQQITRLGQTKFSLTEAYHYALENTFAATPVTPMMQNILRFFQNPIATALVHPFPRFVANKLMWLQSHNPLNIIDFMTPEFRTQLHSVDPLVRHAAKENIAQSMNGLLMLTLMHSVRNSPIAGPKYYEFHEFPTPQALMNGKTGINKGKIVDMRPYDPFVTLMGVGALLDYVFKGKPLNLDENELTDLIVGVRRIGDLGIIGLTTALQSLTDNPTTLKRGVAKVVGGYLTGFTVPIQTLRTLWFMLDQAGDWAKSNLTPKESAALFNPMTAPVLAVADTLQAGRKLMGSPERSIQYKDTTGQNSIGDALTAPLRQAAGDLLPNVVNAVTGANMKTDPSRIDYYTGAPSTPQSPFMAPFGGAPTRETTPLKLAIEKLGVDPLEIRMNYKNAEANNLVAEQFNALLKTRAVDRGPSLEEVLASSFEGLNTPAVAKEGQTRDIVKMKVRGILTKIQTMAVKRAFQIRPTVFLGGKVTNMKAPPSLKEDVQQLIRQIADMEQAASEGGK